MEMFNPLDWPAGPFLTLYGLLATLVLAGLALTRNELGSTSHVALNDLGALHLAYLAGGTDHATDAALVALLEAGVATPDRRCTRIRFDPSVPVAAEFQPFCRVRGAEAVRTGFKDQFGHRWTRLRMELLACGLVPTDAALQRFRRVGAALLGGVVALGSAKVMVGLSRDRPVGILLFLMVLTILLGIILLTAVPYRNAAGTAVLKAARRTHARAARAPMPNEMALAFALSGSAVLAGRPYRGVLVRADMGGSLPGGCGASGCGGGGGGGGGCGGCGG